MSHKQRSHRSRKVGKVVLVSLLVLAFVAEAQIA